MAPSCRLLGCAGYPGASVDEYFYQDEWQGPAKVSDQILLFFGDPLQVVDVPWVPQSLVQNWTLPAAAAAKKP